MRWSLFLTAGFFLAACGSESTTPSASGDAFDLPADKVGIEVRQNLTTDGLRTAVLLSDTTFMYDEERNLDLRGVRVTFYDESGAEAGLLTSDAGHYEMDSGQFVARGNVVLITDGPNGERRLETEQLSYDTRGDLLSTQMPFTLNEAGRITRGTSFRSDAQFRTWEVVGAQTEGTVGGGGDLSF